MEVQSIGNLKLTLIDKFEESLPVIGTFNIGYFIGKQSSNAGLWCDGNQMFVMK